MSNYTMFPALSRAFSDEPHAGDDATETGFYINLPGTTHDVILTAGHNLIDKDGHRSTNLVVLSSDGNDNIAITEDSVKISERYIKRPVDSNAVHDYGAILIPRQNSQPPRPGFGFSLMLGIDSKDRATKDPKDEYLSGAIFVSGYRGSTPPGKPDLSSGTCTIRPEQLEYTVKTQVGLSGSPVWTAYNGVETVVAIHNHGQNSSGRSRGTRLNLRVMRDIFRWASIDCFSQKLRIQQQGAHVDGLYLHFAKDYTMGDEQVGKLSIGTEGMDTTLVVLLAETPPASRMGVITPRYALLARTPWAGLKPEEYEYHGRNWVVWDVDGGRVLLSRSFHPWCLFRLDKATAGTFHIVLYREKQGKESLVRLRMDTSSLTDLQIMLGRREVNGISFVRAIRGKKYKFDQFCLEG
ncbi:hypothetical protein N656DRAFT_845391 [Canariomyces notabilis]|uniref:Serine protease n=1 Tax=Canariomyces notabilis TaxID=2074819 RepID=A0AAN6TCX9_9PEZI|nr:hypothetical protein N656DRAFT_845391 [Canariomyces arenarius]